MLEPFPLPALLGGPPLRPEGPPSWPIEDSDVLLALQEAYRNGSWGSYHGVFVKRLEERLAVYHQVDFALTCGSGTFAVDLALRAMKIGPGDEVILAAYDYGGNFLSVHAVGALPVLVDVHPDNWNLDPAGVAGAIGPATRAIIVSHLHGGVVPIPDIMALGAAHGLSVIEDAAQAPGSVVHGRKAGTWGDVGILSFGGSKLLTAGRGGALLTCRADLHHRARLGLIRGNNICPLSELQAAVLLPQLDKLNDRNACRARSVRLLSENLRDVPGIHLFVNTLADTVPGYYKVGFRFEEDRFGLSRELFTAALRAEGIAVDEGFRALHLGRSASRFRQVGPLVEAERAHQGTVVLHHPILVRPPAEVEQVAVAIRKIHAYVGELRARGEPGR